MIATTTETRLVLHLSRPVRFPEQAAGVCVELEEEIQIARRLQYLEDPRGKLQSFLQQMARLPGLDKERLLAWMLDWEKAETDEEFAFCLAYAVIDFVRLAAVATEDCCLQKQCLDLEDLALGVIEALSPGRSEEILSIASCEVLELDGRDFEERVKSVMQRALDKGAQRAKEECAKALAIKVGDLEILHTSIIEQDAKIADLGDQILSKWAVLAKKTAAQGESLSAVLLEHDAAWGRELKVIRVLS